MPISTVDVAFSLDAGNKALAALLRQPNLWLALHTADPTPMGLASTEVAGNGYERQRIAWSVPNGKAVSNTRKAYFDSMPPVRVWGMAVWDSPSAVGEMIVPIDIPGNGIVVPEDGMFKIEVGDLAILL